MKLIHVILLILVLCVFHSRASAATPAIAAGSGHSLFLKSDGTVWATGSNTSGQLGNGTTTKLSSPVQVMSGVSAISAGGLYSLFLKSDGTVWATGSNSNGQIGNGTYTDLSTPVQVMTGVSAISAGSSHSLFLKSDGTVWATGRNYNGQLGDGTTTDRITPVQVMTGVSAISAGSSHSLFLKSDGTVWTTGRNSYGQLGDGATTDRITPVPVMSGVSVISAGSDYSLFLKSDGIVWATGRNTSGQLGNGATTDLSTPVQVMSGVSDIASGSSHSLFLKIDGTVWATGSNTYGQLGIGTWTNRSTAIHVMSGVFAISAGGTHSLFLKSDGAVWVAGDNYAGQLGIGSTTTLSTPVQVMSGVSAIASGFSHSLFLKSDGTAWAMGSNSNGQIGNGTVYSPSAPFHVMSAVSAIAAGTSHSLFLKSDGTVWAAGGNSYGQLGNGTTSTLRIPVQVMSGVSAISAGSSHSLFLKSDGTVWATGYNIYGQLGNGTTTNISTPVQVMSGVSAIAAGSSYSLFLKTDGTVWATGRNTSGQLGNGATTNLSIPVQVMSGVSAISAGSSHSLFLKIDGIVWATGSNTYGQLGNSTTTDLSIPVQVMSGVSAISAGNGHSLFLSTNGTVLATGRNFFGQLGIGTTTDLSTPVQVMSGVSAISAGDGRSLFLSINGTVWAAGNNLNGELVYGKSISIPAQSMSLGSMSTNADLSGLTLSSGTLSPTFASATTGYTASVANATASITVTPTIAQVNATLAVRANSGTYAAVTSGSPSSSLSLNVGSNTIDLQVTAQDGVTQKIYTIAVTRLASALPPLSTETHHAPVGQSFTYQIPSTSELPVTFRATGLPAGLTLDPVTGIISGTVLDAGTYTVTATVANAAEESSATLTLVVSASALSFLGDTGTIQGCLGQTLDYTFGAANSPSEVGVLDLPPGLRQYDYNDDGVMDHINGIPQVAGFFRVTFWAENALGRCTRSAIIRVNKPAVTTSAQMFEGLDVRAVTKDFQGNTFLGARFSGSVVLGGTTYTAADGNVDGLVIKMSPAGQVLWCYQLTGDGGCDLENLAVDSSGSVIACGGVGSYSSTFSGVEVSEQTFFVVKLTSAGVRSWTRVQGVGGSNVFCGALAIDGSNNIWVGGYFQGSLGFSNSGNTILTSASLEPTNNGFVAGFSSSGTVLTPRLFSSTSVSHIYSLAAAPDGTVFVAGNFSGNLTVPGSGSAPTASITLTNPDGNASQPSFVACIGGAPAGTTMNAAYWAKQIPGGNFFMRNCMVSDSSGGLYVTGYEDLSSPPPSSLPVNSIALPEIRSGAFLMRLSASSSYGMSWIKDLPGNSTLALAWDGANSLYLESGGDDGNFDHIAYNGNTGRYLAKISTSGSVSWVRDSVASGESPFIAADPDGNLAIAAMSDGSSALSIDDQSVTGSGTGLFLLGNATSSGAVPVITSALQVPVVGGRPLSYQIQASNIPTSYWVSDLPEGAQFDESTGVITATTTEAGTYTSTIWAMNAAGYGSATLSVTVSPNPDPQITSSATATATVGQPFSYQIMATNSPTSYSAEGLDLVLGVFGLPGGLAFNAATGVIEGAPTLPGNAVFFVHAHNATGSGSLAVDLTIAGNPAIAPPTVQPDSIIATVGRPLSYQIQATGVVRYKVVSARPAGLTFDPATGLFSGTLTSAGTYQITIQGINGGGVTSALLQLTVNPSTGVNGSLASWRQQHFGSDQNSGNAADLATPDGDGIPNLVKYALMMTPGQNGSSRLPQAAMTGPSGSRRLTLNFQRDPSRSDVSIMVEAQSGLDGAWSEIARSTNGAGFTGSAAVSETSAADGAKSVTVQDVQVDASRRFMRVRVER